MIGQKFRKDLAVRTFDNLGEFSRGKILSEMKRISDVGRFEYGLLKEIYNEAPHVLSDVSKSVSEVIRKKHDIKEMNYIKNLHLIYTEKLYEYVAEYIKKKHNGLDLNTLFPRNKLKSWIISHGPYSYNIYNIRDFIVYDDISIFKNDETTNNITDDIAYYFIFYIDIHNGEMSNKIQEFKMQGDEDVKRETIRLERKLDELKKKETGPSSQFYSLMFIVLAIFAVILPIVATIYGIGYIAAYICTRYDPNIYLIKNTAAMIAKSLKSMSLSWIYVILYLIFYRKEYLRISKRSK